MRGQLCWFGELRRYLVIWSADIAISNIQKMDSTDFSINIRNLIVTELTIIEICTFSIFLNALS